MKLASIFTDKMILQRDTPIRVFGTGNGVVTVRFLGEIVTEKGENGKWCVKLSPQPFGGPYSMGIDLDGKTITLSDILIGDVFLACGQSNMSMPLFRTESGIDDSRHCDNENIRYYTVPRRSKKGEDCYGLNFEGMYLEDKPWSICNEESSLHFSAIGHYFAQYVQRETNVPIGIISCNYGGRRIEAFIEKSYFYGVPALENQMREFKNYVKDLDMVEYEKKYVDFTVKIKEFIDSKPNDYVDFIKKTDLYSAQYILNSGGKNPKAPVGPYDARSPGTLWETMFSEIVPFGVRALLWYQGESNGREMDYYEKYLVFLKCIREQFGCEMDAYAIELAGYIENAKEYIKNPGNYFATENDWAFLREQQQRATEIGERNFLVTSQGLGDLYDIHPKRKKDLAVRLAKKVLRHTYGMDIVADQPIYHSVEFEDGKAYITLDNAEGLYGYTDGVNMYIAGDDHILHQATVEILPDNRLCVYSEDVKEPVLVRYGFCMYYFGTHLYNKGGLPLAPFRTDRDK